MSGTFWPRQIANSLCEQQESSRTSICGPGWPPASLRRRRGRKSFSAAGETSPRLPSSRSRCSAPLGDYNSRGRWRSDPADPKGPGSVLYRTNPSLHINYFASSLFFSWVSAPRQATTSLPSLSPSLEFSSFVLIASLRHPRLPLLFCSCSVVAPSSDEKPV